MNQTSNRMPRFPGNRWGKLVAVLLLTVTVLAGAYALERTKLGKTLSLNGGKSLVEHYMTKRTLAKSGMAPVRELGLQGRQTVKSPMLRAEVAVPEVEIYASLLEDNKGTTMGLYSIPSTGGKFTRHSYGPFAQNGGVYQDGYYFYSFADYYMGIKVYYSFLLNGNEKHWPTVNDNPEQDDMHLCATAMANNPVTNEAYGCFFNAAGTEYELGIIDIHNFTRTTICKLDKGWSGAGFTSDGTLYAILDDGNLATVSLTDGSTTVIGATGLPIDGPTSGTIDYRTDTFFYATNADGDHAMYTIDLATARPTKLFDIPNEAVLGGMFIKYPNIAKGAPAAVTDMSVTFDKASLTGTVNFTAPTLTFDGLPLSGELTYEININDTPAASGKCNAGETKQAPVSVNTPGLYAFTVTVSNDKGKSDEVKHTTWVGPDTPMAPQNLTLDIGGATGLNATLTWDAVTTGEHRGYLDAGNITYTVTRMPDATVVAENIKTPTFTETLDNPTTIKSIYYTVTASCDGLVSKAATSNAVKLGHIVPPYLEGFDNANAFNTFTVVDANKDGATWSFNYDKVQCKFNADADMDDWLITAPIMLEAGNIYDFAIDARAHSTVDTPERFEVMLGKSSDVEAMNIRVLEPTDVTLKTYTRYTAQIIIRETGLYYLGIHGISPKDKYYLYLDNLSISAPYAGDTPGQASDLKVVPDRDGSLNATVSFKAPAVSTNGNPLTDKLDIVVKRNDVTVHTFGGITPGDLCEFRDKAQAIGEYTYTIQASNRYGAGAIYAAGAHLGVSLAPAPLNPKIEEISEGKVRVTWESPTTDVNGNPLDPSAIRYCILDRTAQNVLAEDLKKCEFEMQVLEEGSGRQYFVFFYILAQTDAGVNMEDFVYTDNIPVGTVYTYPFTESVAGGSLEKVWGVTRFEGGQASWATGAQSQQPTATPQDKDGGMAAFAPTADGEQATLVSGKIQIPAAARLPKLSFWYYAVNGEDDKLEVKVADAGKQNWETIKSFSIGEDGNGWRRVVVDMSAYKGKTIQLGLNGVCVTYSTLILVDNIKIADISDSNVGIVSMTAPQRVEGGMKADFTVDVQNVSLADAKDMVLSLERDGEKVASRNIRSLDADSKVRVSLSDAVPVFAPERTVYTARIEWSGDDFEADNVSEPITVKVTAPALPKVDDLTAEMSGNGVNLKWSEPSPDVAPGEILESFEKAESFSIGAVPGWKFIDRDGETTYGIEGVTFPHNGEAISFIVIDKTRNGFKDFHIPSGNKCIAAISNDTQNPNDDWAISPLLDGKPQTIRFSAAAYTSAYGYEAFEYLYSTTDDNPDSFIKVGENKRVGSEWKEYSFDVPQGTRYFAIRCVSQDAFMFLVDDVMFSPAALDGEYPVSGYNVYRDGKAINQSMVAQTTFLDSPEAGNHAYVVTALYPQGESAPSNRVNVNGSGVNSIDGAMPVVYAADKAICGKNMAGNLVSVMSADGTIILNDKIAEDGIICNATPGVYVVTVDRKAYKLIVK